MLGVHRWDYLVPEDMVLPPCRTRLLYVGRLAPHKKIEDLIALFTEYHQIEPECALLLAGTPGPPSYGNYLRGLVAQQPLEVRDRVHFLGQVSDGQLATLYGASSALVMMSEHEGFCIPLVEAMHFGLPIVAYAEPGVRETLGQSGLIFYDKDYPAVARAMHAALQEPRHSALVARQRQRLAEITTAADGSRIWQVLEQVLFSRARTL
jgi:glycosyltransferase involved in cell wall biosynthesis